MAEDMEMSSSYDEPEYEEYAEEAEARIEPFRRRRKPYTTATLLMNKLAKLRRCVSRVQYGKCSSE